MYTLETMKLSIYYLWKQGTRNRCTWFQKNLVACANSHFLPESVLNLSIIEKMMLIALNAI